MEMIFFKSFIDNLHKNILKQTNQTVAPCVVHGMVSQGSYRSKIDLCLEWSIIYNGNSF